MENDIDRERWKLEFYLSESGKIVIDDSLIKNANENATLSKLKKLFLSPDLVTSIVCNNLKFHQNELYSLSKNHHTSKKRALVASYWLKYCDMTLADIAAIFQRSHSTLHRQIMQWNSVLDKHKYFPEAALKNIDNEIQRRSLR